MGDKPVIDYGHAVPWTRKQLSVRAKRVFCIVIVVAILAVWLWVRWDLKRTTYRVNLNNCGYAIRTVTWAAFAYSVDHNGQYPPDLQTLFSWQAARHTSNSDLIDLICPGSQDQRPTKTGDIAVPDHCSYIYLGAGLSIKSDWNCVVAIEDPANHDMQGGYVLLNMPHLNSRFHDLPLLMQCFEDLEAGKNPPSTQTSLTWSTARKLYDAKWKAKMPQLKSGVWKIPQTQPATRPHNAQPEG